jgi:PAS domain S-box-containing protein
MAPKASQPEEASHLARIRDFERLVGNQPLSTTSGFGGPPISVDVSDPAATNGAREQYLHELLQALPAAVYTTDAAGRITFYNEAAAELWGCRPVLGKDEWCGSWRLYWPDGTPMPHDQCPMAVALREDRVVRGAEAIVERPDGSRVHIQPFPTPLRDSAGRLIGAVNMLIDITERKRMDERMRASESRYRGIFKNIGVAVWEQDLSEILDLFDEIRANGATDVRAYFRSHPDRLAEAIERARIRDLNDYALKLFEADRKEDLLGSLGDVLLPETGRVFVDELVALWEGRHYFESETTLRTLKGRRIEVLFTVAFEGERCEHSLVSIIDISARRTAERGWQEQTYYLDTLNRVSKVISSNLDLEQVVQTVTDIATVLSGAKYGAFFYNVTDEAGERYTLYALSGASREDFAKFPVPRNTPLFEATFRGTGIVRSDDIRKDPRYGKNGPHFGMPEGHVPVVSYLAVPVVSRSGEVHGGLFFGHDQPGVFSERAHNIVAGIAAHAAIAIDNANLLRALQTEAADRDRAELSAQLLASIVESSDDAIVSKDLNGIVTSWNRGAERVFGYTDEEMIGRPIITLIPEDHHDEEAEILARIRRGERIDHYDTVRRRKDGSLIDISLTVSPLRDADGRVVGASKIARDITERKRSEQQKNLLLNEIKHRMRNTIATVQAIASQSLRGAPKEQQASFVARLRALGNAHDLLSDENWNQAQLRDVAYRALDPFQDHRDRLMINGPDVWLDARKAATLAMAFHELATNASKYGAWSNAAGQVSIRWDVHDNGEQRQVRVTWQETGGPPVKQPRRKGFGSRLIQSSFGNGTGGARFDFQPTGLICVVEISI